MSIHELLLQDNTYHFIHDEHNGIKYCYASNIPEDTALAIMVYTMPNEIEKCFQRHDTSRHGRDTMYICLCKEYDRYYLTISIAKSEDLNLSHTEVLRIITDSMSEIITKFLEVKNNKKFVVKTINAINGGACEPPIYIIKK